MKKKKNLQLLGFAAIVFLAIALLWLPNIPVDGNTPVWLSDLITNTSAFVATFSTSTTLVIVLVAVPVILIIRNQKNKKNSDGIKLTLAAIILFGAYVLLLPGLAAALPTWTWVADFATFAIDVNSYITTNGGFISFISGACVILYLMFKA